ncbi:GFA family protein [Nitratireductor kimnyeongensis]|uniref:GFA family protein n=1 Tax=Nitratireductor kimnyeongensis TaxID=430679 RepID=A0ABW0T5U6_9HYPH|nr:GFA family protein [Nitratireductor kimnyeongensis]QZZ34290.1 GFA family protein [Nitratireductor kimnyeongensis]
MGTTHSGTCLCGAVRFQISGSFERFYLCHCARCRKGSGSAHAANLFSSAAEITWLSGKDGIESFRVPDARHRRSFCRTCGSALPRVEAGGAMVIVPAGCLDTPVSMQPTAHICMSSRADWDDGLSEVPRLEGLPG